MSTETTNAAPLTGKVINITYKGAKHDVTLGDMHSKGDGYWAKIDGINVKVPMGVIERAMAPKAPAPAPEAKPAPAPAAPKAEDAKPAAAKAPEAKPAPKAPAKPEPKAKAKPAPKAPAKPEPKAKAKPEAKKAPAKPAPKAKAPAAKKKSGRSGAGKDGMSLVDAAYACLKETKRPMNCKEIVAYVAKRGWWKTPEGKTPHATLHAAMSREIAAKGDESRFAKGAERGMFCA